MAERLPPGLTDLVTAHATTAKPFNIMGVVVDFLPPKATRGADWTMTFKLTDSTWNDHDMGEGYQVRYFAPNASLPTIRSLGDIVLLRDIKVCDNERSEIITNGIRQIYGPDRW